MSTLNILLIFICGAIAGGFGIGWLAAIMYSRDIELLHNAYKDTIAEAKRKAYLRGYEERAALQFKPQPETTKL